MSDNMGRTSRKNTFADTIIVHAKMQQFVYQPNEFDHTEGCYITDYCQCVALFIAGVCGCVVPLKTQKRREKQIRVLCVVICNLLMLYSLLGGLVHQYYHEDSSEHVTFSIMWSVATCIGFLAMDLLMILPLLLCHNMSNRRLVSLIITLSLIFVLIPWLIRESIIFLVTITFCDAVLYLIMNSILLHKLKKSTHFKKQVKMLSFTGASILVMVLGAVLQLTKVGSTFRYYNHNAMYHTTNIIGYPVFMMICMFSISRIDIDALE